MKSSEPNIETKTTNLQPKVEDTTSFFQKEQGAPFFSSGPQQGQGNKPFFSPATVQPKLSIGKPDDQYEQEADAVADKVVSQLPHAPAATSVQRQCANCEADEQLQKLESEEQEHSLPETTIQRKPIFESQEEPAERDTIQRKCAACEQEEGKIQAKAVGSEPMASSALQNQLNNTKGSGQSLPEATRSSMESAIGADFSGVRVHTDRSAVQMNKELGAQAFTHGKDVYFNAGKYDTTSNGGQHLLAHELTHVVQQGGGEIKKQDVCEAEDTSEQDTSLTDENSSMEPAPEMCYAPEEKSLISKVNQYRFTPIIVYASVRPSLGIRLHASPTPDDLDYKNKSGVAANEYVQSQGSFVKIIGLGLSTHKGWAKISTMKGNLGWIETRLLNPLSPLPEETIANKEESKPKSSALDEFTRRLHYVEQGDTLEGLIRKNYKDYSYETGNDRRTIAHAFYILNESNPGVKLVGNYDGSFLKDSVADRDFAETRKIYKTIQLFYGHWIRLPNIPYIQMQRKFGTVGVRAEWKNTAIAVGRGIQGFIEGVDAGFKQAAIDMVMDLWGLVKGIFTGELFRKGYKLVKQFIALYDREGIAGIWRVISGFFVGIFKSFKEKWNTPNPRQKWKFIGSLVGMILFEVVLAFLTAGIGNAIKWSGKISKVFRTFPDLDNIVQSGSKKMDRFKATQGDKVKSSKTARDKKRLGYSDDQWEKLSRNEGKKWSDIKGDSELVQLEMDALKKSKPRVSSVAGYDLEIEIPNGHIYRRRTDGKGWCRFSDLPDGCGEIPVDDYVGWDPQLEEQWNRELLSEPGGKQAARDVKDATPKSERMSYLYRQLQRAREQYMGPTPGKRSKSGEAVIREMRNDKRIRGKSPNEEVYVEGPDGKKDWYSISETDMGHHPVDAVHWWNTEGFTHGAQSPKARAWMKDPKNYELQHKVVNRKAGADLSASGVRYRAPKV